MDERVPTLAITIGDPNGIGPEVVLKSLRLNEVQNAFRPVLVGPVEAWKYHAGALDLDGIQFGLTADFDRATATQPVVVDVGSWTADELAVGEVSRDAGRAAMRAVERAVDLCVAGTVDGMVTAPISKEAVRQAGYNIPGHTEFIAARTDADSYAMMMVADDLRVALVTTHRPLRAVAKAITHAAVVDKLQVVAASLRKDFGIERHSIAVLGLNPHAGDGGVIGREELEVIAPAVQQLDGEEGTVKGPFPADAFFGRRRYAAFDAVLAMYHDQGLVPFKTLYSNEGINFTAGLPIVRTSPDHGTAFDIAGTGKASPDSMSRAISLAITVARRREGAAASTTE